MIENIRFLIPNLDRRPDRWEFMQQTLADRGVPPELIERFPATDGLDYLDADENHMNFDLLKEAISHAMGGRIPPFIACDCSGSLTHLAWKWTWYAGLESIARDDDIVCWIIDDFVLDITYEQLLNYTNTLAETAKREWTPFLGIQLCRRPRDDNYSGKPVESCPEFQYGFSSSDDVAIVYSSQGAAWVLDFANRQARHDWTDPCMLAADIRSQRCEGFFGVSEGAGPTENGMATLCADSSLTLASSGEGCSDLAMSRHQIKQRSVDINRMTVNIYDALPQITNFPIYPDANPDVAVVIRLFSDLERGAQMTHMALWAMRSHILNSDMRTYKPTPVFHVERSHYERTRDIFETAGVPLSNIIVYPSDLVTTNLEGNLMHYAAAPLIDPQLERFKRVIVIDSDSFSLGNSATGWVRLMDVSFNHLPQDAIQLLRSWTNWAPERDEYDCWYERGNLGRNGGKRLPLGTQILLSTKFRNSCILPTRILRLDRGITGHTLIFPWIG